MSFEYFSESKADAICLLHGANPPAGKITTFLFDSGHVHSTVIKLLFFAKNNILIVDLIKITCCMMLSV
jgi:hypothetical protein